MTHGTITNKKTGQTLTGDIRAIDDDAFLIVIDGTTTVNTMHSKDWDIALDAPPIKPGIYVPRSNFPENSVIRKYRHGAWRDADGYELADQNVDIARLVRLVPES